MPKALFSYCRYFALCLLCFSFISVSHADSEFESEFFTVQLTNGWHLQGTPQSHKQSLNVTFEKKKPRTVIKIAVGSNATNVRQFIKQLQDTLTKTGARVSSIVSRGSTAYYFDYKLQGVEGYCMTSTNNKEAAVITVLGNNNEAKRFIRTFTDKDRLLFPSL